MEFSFLTSTESFKFVSGTYRVRGNQAGISYLVGALFLLCTSFLLSASQIDPSRSRLIPAVHH